MTDVIKITCRVAATAPGLCLSVTLDGHAVYQGDPYGGHDLVMELDDADGTHALEFTLSGKRADHTRIDSSGAIIEDVTVSVTDIVFDEIALGHLVSEHAKYTHDFNGTQAMSVHPFFGTMGCNGVVRMEFYSPVYLWLLENM